MSVQAPNDFSGQNSFREGASPSKYISLGQYINEVDMPDNRERLVMTYGDQAISTIYGLCYMVGAVKQGGTNDTMQWWEDTRLHNTADGVNGTTAALGSTTTITITLANHKVRVNDNLIVFKGDYAIRAKALAVASTTFTLDPVSTWPVAFAQGETISASIVGNDYAQGTEQPTEFIQSNVVKRENTYVIVKDRFVTTGSQMTNKSWVKLPSGGDAFYWKGEMDTRKRFLDFIEMALITGESYSNSTLTTASLNGVEGYFSALENRGTRMGYVTSVEDLEDLGEVLDQEGGSTEYACYARTKQMNYISRLAAALNQGGMSYGMFNNSPEMAMNLDFTSLKHGGREYHWHTWKLLNDKQLLGKPGQDIYKWVGVPMDTIKDSKTGVEAPLLEINYKTLDGYSREIETWVNGAANGVYNDSSGFDGKRWDMRAEQSMATRAANRHILGK